MPDYRLGELFCGPGGLGYAAINASIAENNDRIIHAWANDYDNDTCNTYIQNICPANPDSVICGDVRRIDLTQFGPIDGFAFGFPCNDFSLVGEQLGFNGTFGPLYTYGIQVLEHYQPQWFLAENVGGITSANEGTAFNVIQEAMINAGYRIYPNLYKFEQYGVPQARHRVIIVGIRNDLPYEFRVPAPTTPTPDTYRTSRMAFEEGNYPGEGNVALVNTHNERTAHPALTRRRLEAIPPGENAWYEGLPEELRLNVKGARVSQIYRRLHPDTPAYTLTGSGGGGTHMYHYAEPRALTNRERARIQTFPDTYTFSGGRESVRKQIGMAVPALGAKIIFEAILKTFANIEYDYVEPNLRLEELNE